MLKLKNDNANPSKVSSTLVSYAHALICIEAQMLFDWENNDKLNKQCHAYSLLLANTLFFHTWMSFLRRGCFQFSSQFYSQRPVNAPARCQQVVMSSLRPRNTREPTFDYSTATAETHWSLAASENTCCWKTRPRWRGQHVLHTASRNNNERDKNKLLKRKLSVEFNSSTAFEWHHESNCQGESVAFGNTPAKNWQKWFEGPPPPLKSTESLNGAQAQVLTPSAVTWLALSRCLSLALSWGWLLRQGNSLHSLAHTHSGKHTHTGHCG